MSRSRWIYWMVAALVVAVATTSVMAVDKVDVTFAGCYNTAGDADGVFVSGSHAYVADGSNGLVILDISNPEVPTLVGSYDTRNAGDVFVSGNYAYVADGYTGLLIVDVKSPEAPVLAGSYDTKNTQDVFVSGNYAYIADWEGDLVIVDVSNPKVPALAGSYETRGHACGVFISGNYAYVADGYAGLLIVDIESPEAPALVGRYDTQGHAEDVSISGNYAYVADGINGLVIVDVENPKAPALAGNYGTSIAGEVHGVFVLGNYAYAADGSNGLVIVDVSNPEVPELAGSYGTGNARDVFVSGKYAYVADWEKGLVVSQYTDMPGRSFIGTSSSPSSIRILDSPSSVRGGEDLEVTVGWSNVPAGWKLSVGFEKSETDKDRLAATRTISGSGKAVFKLNVHPVRERYDRARVHVALLDEDNNPAGVFADADLTVLPASASTLAREETSIYKSDIEPIYLNNFAITPRNPTIRAGDALNWINIQKSPMTDFILVSEDGLWETQTITYGNTFEYRFRNRGNYTYYCPDYGSSMRGTVTVLESTGSPPPSVYILDSPSSVRGGEYLEVTLGWSNIPAGGQLYVRLEKSEVDKEQLSVTRTVSGSGKAVFKLNVHPVRARYDRAMVWAVLLDENCWATSSTGITVLPASTSTSMLALEDSTAQIIKLAGSALLLVAIVLFARKLYGKRKKVSEKPSTSLHKPTALESLPSHEFTPRLTTTSTTHFTTLRTIWDPGNKDFVWDAGKPDEYGELPRIKEWIKNKNPNIYWFLLKIVNHADHPVTEWNVTLYTEQALTITEAHLDEKRVRIVKGDFDTDHNRNICVISIPPELGVNIPANGGRRSMYFKMDIWCEDALKTEFGVSGVVKLGKSPQVEVPVREKRFTYACKYGDFRNMYYGSIDALASMAVTNLQDSYSREIVQNFTNSFRLIRDFEKYCNDRYVESEVLIGKLEVVYSSLKAAEPITKEEILPLVEENLAALRRISSVEAQKERGMRMCEKLVELLHIAMSKIR